MNGDAERGLYPKYRVIKIVDEHSESEGPISIHGVAQAEVTEPCFVLKVSDPAGRAALRTYASMVRFTHPKLSDDIHAMVDEQVIKEFENDQA